MVRHGTVLLLIVTLYVTADYTPSRASGVKPAACPQITSREIASIQGNPYYSAILWLKRIPGQCCDTFSLHVENNTNEPIQILWGKTFYVHNGMREGRLMFRQSACRDADLPQASSISPWGSFEAAVWPETLVHPSRFPQTCSHSPPETGQDGILLTVRGWGMEMSGSLTLNLDSKYLPKEDKSAILCGSNRGATE
jgi:hypothetical protein